MNERAFPDSTADAIASKRRILVVDGSRVVRATLAKRLEESFGVLEEDNGESAWQRLMLDNSIVAVISSVSPPRLAALGLLERMRASALRRLRETPMVLLVSDDNPNANVDEWRRQGIAGFMTRSTSKEKMAECLESVLSPPAKAPPPPEPREEKPREDLEEAPGEPQEKPREKARETAREEKREKARPGRATPPAPLLGTEDFVAAVASLPHEMTSDEPLCVLVFGIDRLGELIGRFGADVPDLLTGRIAKLLAAKIDPRDVLGRCGENCVAIVSHGVDLRAGVHFGRRVCKSMASGQIAFRGRKVRLTTSVGVAATSDDHVESPEDLLALGQARLKQAMTCGGNSVCTELRPDCPLGQRDKALLGLFGLLGEVLEAEQKEALGMAVRPMLRKLDADMAREASLALGLPEIGDDEPPSRDGSALTTENTEKNLKGKR
ncbi:MAG: diguanylate cyclase [Candidatus Accumulibacter sp.]|jgi:diguanylate cyclase (GGDEF)-like protein|nr:diguanylate cyclase [Accumulibacter sp.]